MHKSRFVFRLHLVLLCLQASANLYPGAQSVLVVVLVLGKVGTKNYGQHRIPLAEDGHLHEASLLLADVVDPCLLYEHWFVAAYS